jgi:hypothetical protein
MVGSARTGTDISIGSYPTTAMMLTRSRRTITAVAAQFLVGSTAQSKADHGLLLVPGRRRARVGQQLVLGQIARLAAVEDGLGDVPGEIAEANEPRRPPVTLCFLVLGGHTQHRKAQRGYLPK